MATNVLVRFAPGDSAEHMIKTLKREPIFLQR